MTSCPLQPDSDYRKTYDLLMSFIVKRIKLDRERKRLQILQAGGSGNKGRKGEGQEGKGEAGERKEGEGE